MPSDGNLSGKRALITGITGQAGAYLAELLLAKGFTGSSGAHRSSTRTASIIFMPIRTRPVAA
jgi:GDPmannose 4,6-dehydratase